MTRIGNRMDTTERSDRTAAVDTLIAAAAGDPRLGPSRDARLMALHTRLCETVGVPVTLPQQVWCCRTCWDQHADALPHDGMVERIVPSPMFVCDQCGDKRCPRANDHARACQATPVHR